jgi:hypothetical protein
MQALTSEHEIAKAQARFSQHLSSRKEVDEVTLGYQGGNIQIDAHYIEEYDFWYATSEFDGRSKIPKPRYWNGFGLHMAQVQGNNHITCEINFHKSNPDGRVSGLFVKEDDKIWVCHTGGIIGGKNAFLRDFPQEQFTPINLSVKVFKITFLDSNSFFQDIKNFILTVDRYKQIRKLLGAS